MNTRRRPAQWFVACLPSLAVMALVGCNGLPLALVGAAAPNLGVAGSIIPGDEVRFKPAITQAVFSSEFKKDDADGDGQWSGAELSSYLIQNPLPEAFLVDLEAMELEANSYQLLAELTASASVDVSNIRLDDRVRKLLAKILARFDADRNGSLSAEEAFAFRLEAYKRRARPAPAGGASPAEPPVAPGGAIQSPPKPGIAVGEPNPGMPGGFPGRFNGDCKGDFTKSDTNQDGALTWEEHFAFLLSRIPGANGPVSAAIALDKDATYAEFKKRDLDGNGQLNLTEFCGSQGGGTVPPPPPNAEDCYGRYKNADRNGDAKLSWEEFYALEGAIGNAGMIPGSSTGMVVGMEDGPAIKERIHDRFMKLDRNGNGFFEAEEWTGACSGSGISQPPAPPVNPVPPVDGCALAVKVHDGNGDGRLDLAEFGAFMDGNIQNSQASSATAARDWEVAFAQRDLNHDGFVDPAEACGRLELPTMPPPSTGGPAPCDELKRLDANGDGKVSLDEHIRMAANFGPNLKPEDKLKMDALFQQRDANKDGFWSREEMGCN